MERAWPDRAARVNDVGLCWERHPETRQESAQAAYLDTWEVPSPMSAPDACSSSSVEIKMPGLSRPRDLCLKCPSFSRDTPKVLSDHPNSWPRLEPFFPKGNLADLNRDWSVAVWGGGR